MRVLLFCGHLSRYGLAHLSPVLDQFDMAAVVLAPEGRWAHFREALAGRSNPPGALLEALRQRVSGTRRRLAERRATRRLTSELARRGVPVVRAPDVNETALLQRCRAFQPELVISAAYPQIFGRELLALAPRGAVNFHPSLLPRCRGAHPHFWAIATGEAQGGVTAHFMTEALDQGDIVAQVAFPIRELYYTEYYDRIVAETPRLVAGVRAFLTAGDRVALPQDSRQATLFRNDREIHHRIMWDLMNSGQVLNLIRTEQAFCFFGRRRVGLRRARLVEGNRNLTNGIAADAGVVVDLAGDAVVVAVRGGCLGIELVMDGRTLRAASAWASRRRVRVGERLG